MMVGSYVDDKELRVLIPHTEQLHGDFRTQHALKVKSRAQPHLLFRL